MIDEIEPPAPHHVVVLALPGVVLLDLAAPTHLFGHCGADRYRFEVVGERPGPVATSTGLPVVCDRGLDALAEADTIVVPGRNDLSSPGPATLVQLIRAAERGARMASVCTGAFVLAHAGLLDGLRATTHWQSCALLARRFPAVTVDPSVLYVDEGPILTSAGVAAGLDLCLHLVARDQGQAFAADVARRTVIAPHRPGGQAQFLHHPVATGADGGLSPVLAWAVEHLDGPMDNAMLAGRAGLAPRTFARRFASEVGTTPADWLAGQRCDLARRLLEETALPVDQVAHRCGFGSAATLRQQFASRVRTSPSAYRRSFQPDG